MLHKGIPCDYLHIADGKDQAVLNKCKSLNFTTKQTCTLKTYTPKNYKAHCKSWLNLIKKARRELTANLIISEGAVYAF